METAKNLAEFRTPTKIVEPLILEAAEVPPTLILKFRLRAGLNAVQIALALQTLEKAVQEAYFRASGGSLEQILHDPKHQEVRMILAPLEPFDREDAVRALEEVAAQIVAAPSEEMEQISAKVVPG